MVTEQHVGPAAEPTLRDLRDALVAVFGTDYGAHDPTSISRFSDMTGRPPRIARDECCWPAMPRTSMPRTVDRV